MKQCPLIMHVNYGEPDTNLQNICELAKRTGYDGVEFRRKRFDITESETDYLDALAAAVEKTDLQEVRFGYPGPDLKLTDRFEREAQIESAAQFYETAHRRFRTSVFNTSAGDLRNPDPSVPGNEYARHGSSVATEDHWQWAIEGFQVLGARAEAGGYRLAFETHPCYLHDTLPATLKLVEGIASPAVGVLLDCANLQVLPDPPTPHEAVQALGEQCFYVHLKNLITLAHGDHLRIGLADGEINTREFLCALKDIGYQGAFCIEAPRPGDRHHFARRDLDYLQSLLRDLQWPASFEGLL